MGRASAALMRERTPAPGISENSWPDSRSPSKVPANKGRSRRRGAHAGLGAQRVGTGGGRDTRREQDDAEIAAILRGSLFEDLAADAGAGGGRGGVERLGLFADIDGAACGGELELDGLF